MIKRTIYIISALLLAIIVSPLLALVVGVAMGVTAFFHFWKGVIDSLRNHEKPNLTGSNSAESIWDKHIRLRGLPSDDDTKKTDE